MNLLVNWFDPVWLIWFTNVLAAFAIGNAYGQDKIRLQQRRED